VNQPAASYPKKIVASLSSQGIGTSVRSGGGQRICGAPRKEMKSKGKVMGNREPVLGGKRGLASLMNWYQPDLIHKEG
jgi:hypothetical protein